MTVCEKLSLENLGIQCKEVLRNASVPVLYEEAIRFDAGSAVSDQGALIVRSGDKTGRSPSDKRIVQDAQSQGDIWWGKINIPLDERTFQVNRERAVDYLNTCPKLYVVDGFAGWDPKYQIKVRVICTRPYHALFMHNMLIRPSAQELADFGEPDYVIYNAGRFPANRFTSHMTSKTSVDLSFERREFVILGTEYAGEMKKGIFTVMHYTMPKAGVFSMHCSANQGDKGDVSLFFGLSGTGKTTLSADPRRKLIGDDEHCWTDEGVFNIEGGCYAKCINLSPEKEPEIYSAIRYGSLLENVRFNPQTRQVDYDDDSITENTRASYPIDYISNALIPCRAGHPSNIILLTCDAFGVLPPVARLTPAQAMYHFISGYTAKVAGTEQGITEPKATFSACFGAAFLVWHPGKYAEMLAEKMRRQGSSAWLVNTGWTGGPYGTGSRFKLPYTRAIIDAIHGGDFEGIESRKDPIFGFSVPSSCPGVPDELMDPRSTWKDPRQYDQTARNLADMFRHNFEQYRQGSSPEIAQAGPKAASPA